MESETKMEWINGCEDVSIEIEQLVPLIQGELIHVSQHQIDQSALAEVVQSVLQNQNVSEQEIHDDDTVKTLMTATGIDVLLNNDESLFEMFQHSISTWFRAPYEATFNVICNSGDIDTVIFMQFILAWFSGCIAGSFPSHLIGLRDKSTPFELFIPIKVPPSILYKRCPLGELVIIVRKFFSVSE
jgi:hypothetical protein